MKINSIAKFSDFLAITIVWIYLLTFFGSGLFYCFKGLEQWLLGGSPTGRSLLTWTMVGLSVSLLASLVCWPFALSIATLIEHNKNRRIAPIAVNLLGFLSTLPLIVYAYVYVEVVSASSFMALEKFWTASFAAESLFTQAVAFALTLLLYPLTIFPVFSDDLSVDAFYQEMLTRVIDFAEVGLVASVIVIGLFLYIMPKMVLYMRRQLHANQSLRSFDIIKSVGGTPWESIHLTVMQSMKDRFNSIIVYFTRICFFEGLITFTLLQFFFVEKKSMGSHWGSSLTSQYLHSSILSRNELAFLFVIAGLLVFCYALFLGLERHFRRRIESTYV